MSNDHPHFAAQGAARAEPVSHHAAFVLDAYAAAFDRTPCSEEVAEQCLHLEAGMPLERFLSSLLQSEERRLVIAARDALGARDPATADWPARFVSQAYRTVLGREPDEDGLADHVARLSNGMSPTEFLAMLHDSEEAVACRDRHSQPHLDMESFVRATFRAVLDRDPEEGTVASFVKTLTKTMDLAGFSAGLAGSAEGRELRGRQATGALNAACLGLMLRLESMLCQRGLVLDLGPPPVANMSAERGERLLKRLARTIEMVSVMPAAARLAGPPLADASS